jgi:hypothetical protein
MKSNTDRSVSIKTNEDIIKMSKYFKYENLIQRDKDSLNLLKETIIRLQYVIDKLTMNGDTISQITSESKDLITEINDASNRLNEVSADICERLVYEQLSINHIVMKASSSKNDFEYLVHTIYDNEQISSENLDENSEYNHHMNHHFSLTIQNETLHRIIEYLKEVTYVLQNVSKYTEKKMIRKNEEICKRLDTEIMFLIDVSLRINDRISYENMINKEILIYFEMTHEELCKYVDAL